MVESNGAYWRRRYYYLRDRHKELKDELLEVQSNLQAAYAVVKVLSEAQNEAVAAPVDNEGASTLEQRVKTLEAVVVRNTELIAGLQSMAVETNSLLRQLLGESVEPIDAVGNESTAAVEEVLLSELSNLFGIRDRLDRLYLPSDNHE